MKDKIRVQISRVVIREIKNGSKLSLGEIAGAIMSGAISCLGAFATVNDGDPRDFLIDILEQTLEIVKESDFAGEE